MRLYGLGQRNLMSNFPRPTMFTVFDIYMLTVARNLLCNYATLVVFTWKIAIKIIEVML